MADRSALRSEQDPIGLPRRAVLGASLGASAALITGTRAATGAPPIARKRRPAQRHISYQEFRGEALRSGTHSGTEWSIEGLRIGSSTGVVDYTDRFAGNPVPVSYETATWTSPVIRTPFETTELIPSWEAETPGKTWIELAVRGTDETGTVSGWYLLGRWCAEDPAGPSTGSGQAGAIHRTSIVGQDDGLATVLIDTLRMYDPHRLSDWQLRVTLLRPAGTDESPLVRMAGGVASRLPDVKSAPVSPIGVAAGIVLDVPPLSQEVHVGHYPRWDNGGEAWCSPTCTAMVLEYWNAGPTAEDLEWVDPPVDAVVDFAARNVFDYAYNGAGNWPFNTAYAARYGLRGFVTRLRSFTEAELLIKAGIPLIISVSFKANELDGAGYGTGGHLMVVAGFTDDGDVVVNDPASHLIPDNDEVRFTYRRDQLENAWLPKSGGTTYVIHPASIELPQPLVEGEPNW